jgi:type IV pilus assembly protein PilY1
VAGLEESNCKAYSDGSTTTYKPTGLLQRYGDDELMSFGLITGSYQNNMRGGVLRKNIASFQDEIDLDTGIFSNSSGIIDTIDKLRIARFNFSNHLYSSGFIKTREINNGEAQDWGNPIAEMMYEGLRYFTGKTTATPEFVAGVTSGTDGASLGLPEATWLDPYRSSGGADYCATPVQLVISDVNTSYDSDHLPGAYFPIESGSNKFSGDISDLNVSTIANEIWSEESEASNVFIGQSKSDYDGSPSPKSVDSFASIRGHAPEEATKQGSFYSASIAKYGQRTDLRTDLQDNQNMDTLAVALASPLPRIEVPINSSTVTIVPFAKSVSNSSINSEKGQYQPTNQIVDFFVETIANTGASNKNASINAGRPYGKFRINFEADEQAADHDMDAIVEYEFLVNASNELIVNLDSIYAAAGTRQHIGYVISGTTKDGTYLEVRDADINDGDDTDYFLDTPPGVFPGGAWEDSIDLPLTTSRTFTVGTTTSASFIKHDPLWYAAKWASEERVDDPDTAQNEEDGNDTLDQAEWDSDNDGVPDGYFLVTNAGKLAEQLQNAFSQIVSRTSSSAAAATNSKRLVTSAKVYQARFNSTEWFGELLAFSLNSDGAISTQDWNAADRILNRGAGSIITPAGRDIFTYSYSTSGSNAYEGTGGLLFNDIDLLNDEQQTYLNTNGFGVVDGLGSDRINYLRGDQSKEKQNGGSFRNRSSLMGDIVNSDPWFSGQFEDFGYSLLSGDEGDDYSTFRNTKLTRTPALFFGANDGMLHAINADKGYELFTFVPAGVYSKLSKLTSEFYGCTGSSNCLPHEYFVDGAAKSGDVYINQDSSDMTSVDTEDTTTRDWATVLVSTLGAGGQGLFALDVTTPSTFTSSNVLWEISTTFAPDSSDLSTHFKNNLGYTLSQASIVRMYDGSWAAIVANGYDSNNNTAALYVIDIKTGKVIADFYTQVGSSSEPNGMSTPIAIDYDGDKITDTIYAGDLQGNLWKIDVKDTNPNKWKFAFKSGNKPAPFFKAVDADGVAQPITSKPQVGVHPKGGLMVYFGTGKYFETGDDVVGSSPQIQTFYGVRDEGSSTERSKLQKQTIVYEANNFNNTDLDIRVTSDTQVIYSESITGWYIDLKSPNLATNAGEGERVVSAPLLRAGRIIFVTLIPESDPCGWGGTSWLMEMDAINGARLNNSPLDIDGDGDIDTIDMIAYFDSNGDNVIDDKDLQVAVSGVRRQSTGIIKTPGVMSTGNDKEVKYVSGSSGALDKFTESSGDPSGRQSWRQIK